MRIHLPSFVICVWAVATALGLGLSANVVLGLVVLATAVGLTAVFER